VAFARFAASPRARELGALGGQGPTRRVLGFDESVADDRLRAKAKARLEALLDSEDEGKRLAPARALYTYGPAKPPTDEATPEWHPNRPAEPEYDVDELVKKMCEYQIIRCPTCGGPVEPGAESLRVLHERYGATDRPRGSRRRSPSSTTTSISA
jgi:hypothetical protein